MYRIIIFVVFKVIKFNGFYPKNVCWIQCEGTVFVKKMFWLNYTFGPLSLF
jgi:hypothetical protein